MRHCDAVVCVPGWQWSEGASQEVRIARTLGMPVYEWPEVPA